MSAPSPFSRRAALGLVVGGSALFIALLWLIGSGLAHGPVNNGGAHGAGTGLNGYAALSRLLEAQGWEVKQARTEAALKSAGLAVLTPPADAPGADLARVVAARRFIGPTLVVTPKWLALPLDKAEVTVPGAKKGWVALGGTQPPEWKGFLDDVGVTLAPLPGARWTSGDSGGPLAAPKAILSGQGANLVPLVVVFEPDLLNNQGLARSETALHALRLLAATAEDAPREVTFDLSFNGFRRAPNLLTLAFTPPFLAATLCLLLAALIAGWRAFLRFGPPHAPAAVTFGKGPLVANAGGLVRRSGRLWLLGPPYAALVRDRLARTLGLPARTDPAATEAAIDRIVHASDPEATPFSALANTLRTARRRAELLRAAADLHALERKLHQ